MHLGAGYADPLLLPTRQLRRVGMVLVLQTD